MSANQLYRQYETVNLCRRGAGAMLQLNRPDRMNAWSNQFSLDLLAAIREVTDDKGIRAVLGTKRQLNRWLYEQMEDQFEFEAGIQRETAASGDFAEGIAAFVEKRAPRFSGA